jgi:hypothetical protein
MTLGSCMESPSGSGQTGIGIRGSSLMVRELHLASALESAFLVGTVGAGTTGDTIGITTAFVSTITTTSHTAESSPTATTSIAAVDFMTADFAVVASPTHGASAGRITDSTALVPVHSAALTMEESREGSPIADGRALAEASVEVVVSEAAVFTGEAAVAGNSVPLPETRLMIWRKNSCAQTI